MKLAIFSALLPLALASPIFERESQCSITGIRGRVPAPTEQKAFRRIAGAGNLEACDHACKDPTNSKCKAFSLRTSSQSGGGACLLYDFTVSIVSDAASNVVVYNLPQGVVGGTPHNNPAWYAATPGGSYEACRGICLGESQCRGFGYKEGGNCRRFSTTLTGRVSPNPTFPYIHYQNDCTYVTPA